MAGYLPTNPRKLTDTVATRLVEMFRLGATNIDACRYAGIDDETLRLWIIGGRQELDEIAARGDDPMEEAEPATMSRQAALVLAIEGALGEFAKEQLTNIKAAGNSDWRAPAWLMERRFPKEWGKRTQVDHTHELVERTKRLAESRNLDEDATARLIDFVLAREKKRSA